MVKVLGFLDLAAQEGPGTELEHILHSARGYDESAHFVIEEGLEVIPHWNGLRDKATARERRLDFRLACEGGIHIERASR